MQRDLRELAGNKHDLLVIGGGIYGACVAWDAALRGLSVGLVEKEDFGHATSSNTLRVIHGGLRYLQHGDIRRMRRSIHERMVFMRIAPHLVHPLPFLIPTYGHFMRGKQPLTLALLLNDLIGFDRNRLEDPQKYIPRSRVISRSEYLRLVPGAVADGLTGGACWYDCQIDGPERMVLCLLRSAAGAGATVANYVEALGFLRRGDRILGVRAKDRLTGDELDIRADVVVNTGGPWVDRILGLLNGDTKGRKLVLSKAFNLLIKRQLIPQYAIGVYSKRRFNDRDAMINKGSRLFFITPWHGHSLIGTRHLSSDADPDNVKITESEIQVFLDELNEAYPAAGVKRDDVCCVYGGLLPMVPQPSPMSDVQLLKRFSIVDHRKEEDLDGLISVIGVKFTEARYVAERTVGLVFTKRGRRPPASLTAMTPIHGGQIGRFTDFLAAQIHQRPKGLDGGIVSHLVRHYGSEYPRVIRYLDEDPSWGQPVVDGSPVILAEVLHGIREEMAQTLSDVVFRRTELGMLEAPGEGWLDACAAAMAKELGWSEARTHRELEEVQSVFSLRARSS